MKIALAQIQATDSLEVNLQKMQSLVEKAALSKSELIVFPEMAYFSGTKEKIESILPLYQELNSRFSQWAKKYQIGLIPGTVREPCGPDSQRYYNTLLFFNPDGKCLGKYRKIFRFEANLPHHKYQESKFCEGGNEIVTASFNDWCFGFAICFDLRFPELFRSLRKKGARVIVIPSAFTVPTGEAHWEILLRARAIENQSYVVAVDQTGISGEGLSQYGHSLVIDPWGKVISRLGTEEELSVSEFSKNLLQEVESQICAWPSRNEALFPIR